MASFFTPTQVSGPKIYGMPDPNQPQGPIASTMQGAGPRIYMPPAQPLSPPEGSFNMSDYLSSKFGASAPQIRSIMPTNQQAGPGGGVSQLGGGGGGDIQSALMKQFSDAQAKANSANEGRFNAARKELAGFGSSYTNDINRGYQADVGQQEQGAISRGLGNSTIRNSLLGGALRRKNDAMLSLKDRLASQRVNLLQSKFDNGPDPVAISQLFAQANQGAYGSGNTLSSIASSLGLTR